MTGFGSEGEAILRGLVERRPDLAASVADIEAAVAILCDAAERDAMILACGNGGSAADADHLVAELVKGFLLPRSLDSGTRTALEASGGPAQRLAEVLQRGIRAVSLNANGPLFTAILNDQGPEAVFAQQVLGLGRRGDVLLCISTSGNSPNVVAAASVARAMGLHTIALVGPGKAGLEPWCDVAVHGLGRDPAEIQESHRPLIHALCACVEARLFSS